MRGLPPTAQRRAFGSGQAHYAPDTGDYALWGQDASPLYGATIAFGDDGGFVEVLPSTLTAATPEVGGILLCLSCHDGNVTPNNMMTNQLYEQKVGLLTNTVYGIVLSPRCWAKMEPRAWAPQRVATTTTITRWACRQRSGRARRMVWYSVAAFSRSLREAITTSSFRTTAGQLWRRELGAIPTASMQQVKPYVLCTTCHNQHVMNVYASTAKSPIKGDGGGKYYATYFFINGPYNPNISSVHQPERTFDHSILPPVPLWRGQRSEQPVWRNDRLPMS